METSKMCTVSSCYKETHQPINISKTGSDRENISDKTSLQTRKQGRRIQLSFRGIHDLAPYDLSPFSTLLELDLNNNNLGKISGLESLVLLRRLNLSFNNISKIEGLNTLCRLTSLSLYHNKITEATGLNKCSLLQSISLGENCIKSIRIDVGPHLESLIYLRDLNLIGNPIVDTQEQDDHFIPDNYKPLHWKIILHFVPTLVYFNNVKIAHVVYDEENDAWRKRWKLIGVTDTYVGEENDTLASDSALICCSENVFVTQGILESIHGSSSTCHDLSNEEFCSSLNQLWSTYVEDVSQHKCNIAKSVTDFQYYAIHLERWHLDQHFFQGNDLALANDRNRRLESHSKDQGSPLVSSNDLLDKEIRFAEQLGLKTKEMTHIFASALLQIKICQSSCVERMEQVVERYMEGHCHKTEDQSFNFDACLKHLATLHDRECTKILNFENQFLQYSDSFYIRHRQRVIDLAG